MNHIKNLYKFFIHYDKYFIIYFYIKSEWNFYIDRTFNDVL